MLLLILLPVFFLLLLLVPYSFRRKVLLFYLPTLVAVLLTVGMIQHPREAFEASLHGLAVWWDIVFPALLPFFIFAQVLIGLGVVHALGILLEPVMRPLFNVPGEGSFVMAMGLASGFPLGAVLTGKLRQSKMCSKIEAERLLSFVNTADPLFMFGAVAIGMLNAPQTGSAIVIAHYLSAITVGLVMRFYRRGQDKLGHKKPLSRRRTPKNLLGQALAALVTARQKDGRPFGQILGDAVQDSINTLLLIGGFIMLFAVAIAMLENIGLVDYCTTTIGYFLETINLNKELAPAFFSGFMEIDLGCQLAGTLPGISLEHRVIAVSAIIAWSGLSVHAQVASIISPTDMSVLPYSLARILHSILAAFYSMLLLGPIGPALFPASPIAPVLRRTVAPGSAAYWWETFMLLSTRCVILLACMLLISFFVMFKTGRTPKRR